MQLSDTASWLLAKGLLQPPAADQVARQLAEAAAAAAAAAAAGGGAEAGGSCATPPTVLVNGAITRPAGPGSQMAEETMYKWVGWGETGVGGQRAVP